MELTTDVLLRGPRWAKTIDELSPIFMTRTNYSIFILCVSIGIMYDQRIEKFEDDGSEPRNVPRNVMQNNDGGKLDFMFQAAILSTKTLDLDEESRLKLAFGDEDKENTFNKIGFLTQFANFGMTILEEKIGETVVESMDNIKNFLVSTVEGNNFDINALPDETWLDDIDFL